MDIVSCLFKSFGALYRVVAGKLWRVCFIHSLYWEKGLPIVVVQGIEGLKSLRHVHFDYSASSSPSDNHVWSKSAQESLHVIRKTVYICY